MPKSNIPKRCPPGVICFENVTIILICVVFAILGLWVYIRSVRVFSQTSSNASISSSMPVPPTTFMNIQSGNDNNRGRGNDVFLDIYQAPLRDDRCSLGLGRGSDMRPVPVNIPTQGCGDAEYRQVGILTRLNGKDETILPLMGRPLFTRRDKWNFYTLNDKNNMIKLPVTVKGRSGTDEYGCDNVYTGDTVYVEGYNGAFKVTAYDNQVMRYLPSL